MSHYIFLPLLLLLQIPALTMGCDKKTVPAEQGNDIWTSFWNEDSTKIGYKDKNGVVKIEPKFDMVSHNNFSNIIAVSNFDAKNNKRERYYLTKNGKIVGRDSVYYFENTIAYECNGFILFNDPKTKNYGLFDRNGNVVIPAEYNSLSNVRGGMMIALKGAERKYKENDDSDHNPFVGGKRLLIDTLNNILIEDFFAAADDSEMDTYELNFFSVEKTEVPHKDTTRVSFPAKGGGYYSFIVYEREFKRWLFGELLANLTPEKLMDAMQEIIAWNSILYQGESNGRQFAKDNFDVLKNELSAMLNPNNKYYISTYRDSDNCEAHSEIGIIISVPKSNDNNFYFSRTDNGYKLSSVTIRNVNSFRQNPALVKAAKKIINRKIVYDPAYVKIKYPMGDVDPGTGVCTDVVIRSYRGLGIDLQKEVHEDMKTNFSIYPRNWGMSKPDPNIDHRRVPNLMTFFSRKGKSLPITDNPADYKPGDIVCWDLGDGVLHIGIVLDNPSSILHNIGGGQIAEDCLFAWKIIGHYSY